MTHFDDATVSLPPVQQLALAALLEGQTITDAAAIAGVSRRSLHRWLRDDIEFIAAFNAGRNDLRSEAQATLLAAASGAVAAVRDSVRAGNVAAAFGLLRGLGLLHGAPMAAAVEDPAQLRRAAADAEEDRRAEEEFRRCP